MKDGRVDGVMECIDIFNQSIPTSAMDRPVYFAAVGLSGYDLMIAIEVYNVLKIALKA